MSSNSIELPRTRAILESGLKTGLHLGAAVAVNTTNQLGISTIAVGTAPHPDQRILWLSAGKPLTALTLAWFVQAGQIDLEAPVAEYLPEFACNGKDAVTVKNLLNHTHGYRPPPVDWSRHSRESVLSEIYEALMIARAGDRAAYDPQTGWYLLSEIIERLGNAPYHDTVSQKLLKPLGLDSVSIGADADRWTNMLTEEALSRQHDTTKTAADKIDLAATSDAAPFWPGDNVERARAHNPGGGALGTCVDLCRFYASLMECLDTGHDLVPGISCESLRRFTKPSRRGMHDETFKMQIDWGLGFLVNSAPVPAHGIAYGYGSHASEETFGHGGVQSVSGFCDPVKGIAAAIIFNGLPGEPKHHKRNHQTVTALYEDVLAGYPRLE